MQVLVLRGNTKKIPDLLIFFIILLLAVITRLPQLLSPHLYIDGDEAVVGLMARHIAEGKDFSAYFYGQHYGFSLLEVLPIALFFKLFGYSVYAMKLCMLVMWSGGLYFMFKAMRRMKGKWVAYLLICFMLSIPAWASWAMKARGGYITAFLFSAWVIYLCIKAYQSEGHDYRTYLLIGVFMSIIYESQSLWIPGLVPWILFLIYKKKAWKHALYFVAGGFVTLILIKGLTTLHMNTNFWSPDFIGNYINIGLDNISSRVYDVLHGTFTVFLNYDIGRSTNRVAERWLIAGMVFVGIQVIRLITGKFNKYSLLFTLSIILTVSYTLVLNPTFYNARHLLPLAQFIVAGVTIELTTAYHFVNLKKLINIVAIGFLLWFGPASLLEFKNMDEERDILPEGHTRLGEMHQMVQRLKDRQIRYVFSMEGMMQWQLALLSNEEIIPRAYDLRDRYAAYGEEVNKAYLGSKPTALLGNKYEVDIAMIPRLSETEAKKIFYLGNGMYAYPNPDLTLLQKLGFQF